MVIVGICGAIGHGKSTFAANLASATTKSGQWESWEIIAEVANELLATTDNFPPADNLVAMNDWLKPLDQILARVVHSSNQLKQPLLYPKELEEHPEEYRKLLDFLGLIQDSPPTLPLKIDASNKGQFRSLLQWLGGYLVLHLDDGLWYKEILKRIKTTEDLDLAVIGGVRFPSDADQVHGAGGHVIRVLRPSMEAADLGDLTERQADRINVDCQIFNNGDLEQLSSCAKKVYQDLAAGHLADHYSALTF